MATESLKIVVGADISSATAAFKGLGDTLRDAGQDVSSALAGAASAVLGFGNATKSIGRAPLQDLNAYKAAVNSLKETIRSGVPPVVAFTKSVKDVPAAANAAAAALKKIPAGANAAGFALTNVGRVAQDLPFGFIGIQNNLNPLLESFQRLKAETGSTGGALKALGSSLIGPAGIGLALSVVSSAFVIFQNGISGFNKKSKEAKESADELAKSIKNIGQIQGEAAASVQGELAQVKTLASVVSDSNKPYADRKRALQELTEINKSYFGDLRVEDALTGKLAASVNEYSKALVNSAIQKSFAEEISNVAKASAKANTDIQKSRDALTRAQASQARAQQQLTEVQKNAAKTDAIGVAGSSKVNDALNNRAGAISKVTDAEKALKTAQEVQTKLIEQRLQLESELNAAVLEGAKFKDLDDPKKGDKEGDAIKKRIEALKKLREEVGLTKDQQFELLSLEVQLLEKDGIKLGFTKEEIQDQVRTLIDRTVGKEDREFVTSRLKIRVGGDLDFTNIKTDIPKIKTSVTIDPIFDKIKFKNVLTDEGEKLQAESKQGVIINVPASLKLDKIPDGAFQPVVDALKKGSALTNDAAKQITLDIGTVAATLQDAIIGAFDGLGAAIGEAFSGGSFGTVLAKFGETILKVIGGVLQDIGKQIVVASKLVAVLKKVLSSVGLGAASLVVGLALVALGGVLKNIKFSTPQFEKGGIASGPRSGYLATLHGTELIIPMNKIDKRPAASTGIQGGGNGIVILQPSLSIDGRSIKVMLDRIGRTDNRIF